MKNLECVFCTPPEEMHRRIIKVGQLSMSLISNPRFIDDHCLIIPLRHIETVGELNSGESSEIMQEMGRLATLLDRGHGTGMMQKYQPRQSENGIKVNHLHFHVFPRIEGDDRLFPVPDPNSFDGFRRPSKEELEETLEKVIVRDE